MAAKGSCRPAATCTTDNEAHLDYLERFIASKNRDRDFPSPPGNRGLSYKLPKWMQAATHREELLRTIARLRQRLA